MIHSNEIWARERDAPVWHSVTRFPVTKPAACGKDISDSLEAVSDWEGERTDKCARCDGLAKRYPAPKTEAR